MRRTALLLLLLFASGSALAEPSAQVAFSPGGATGAVVQVIGEAKVTIRLAAYGFTSKPVAQALVAAKGRGVDVKAVLDKSNATARYSAATFLSNAGVPVRVDGRYAIMHSKYLVIDGVTVETGSFNFTRAAEVENAENVIVLREQPEVARQYEANWLALWNESAAYP